jgi:hypothetical protein
MAAVDQGKLSPGRRKILAKQVIRLLLRHGAAEHAEFKEA